MTLLLKGLKNIDMKVLNEREQQKCIETFNAYDKNGSRRLEKEELRMVL
jgi:Ca2+-binding EF-hand superfamily protein